MAEDEDATVRTLRAWREQVAALVAEHRGRLADFTAALRSGDPLRALESFRRGMRLNPRLESSAPAGMMLAQIHSQAGRPEEAEALWQQASAENSELIPGRLWLAAYLEGTGRQAEAREVVREALDVNPELSVEAVRQHGLFARLPDLETFLARLRAAGLP